MGWWDRVPQAVKDAARAKTKTEYDAWMEVYKERFKHLKFGQDVTDREISVKASPPESGFVDEPEVYDDFAYSGTGKVSEPDVIILDDELGLTSFAPGAFATEVGKTVPLKSESGRVIGEATVTGPDGEIEFKFSRPDDHSS